MDDQQYPFDENLSPLELIGIYLTLVGFALFLGYMCYVFF